MTTQAPAVSLDYDGVLTPIIDRLADAVTSDDIREAAQALAQRCVASGRDRSGDLITETTDRLRAEVGSIPGAADFVLRSPVVVRQFRNTLAR